jgi:DNA-directed RNA polymerase specialized sigma24 family protein
VNVPGELEQHKSHRWTHHGILAYAQTSELLTLLPQDAGTAAALVYVDGYSLTEAADIMKKSRFAVARLLNQARRIAAAGRVSVVVPELPGDNRR